jgi:D-alanine-D-alanine ligase
MKVLLLTGPGGDAQGWGDLNVTRCMAEAAETFGYSAPIAYVETEGEFLRVIEDRNFDIVWSALYHISRNEKFVGKGEGGMWVADVLDEEGIPYIGSNSQVMKDMIDKFRTHVILSSRGVPVPGHHLVQRGADFTGIRYPAFVKPMCESRSVGISEESVVYSPDELVRRVIFIEQEYDQPALVEDFMPGDEYTTLVLGNGASRKCLPGLVTVEEQHYGRHRILRSDLRGVGLTHINPPGPRAQEAAELAGRAAEAMNCRDHIRIDIKTDACGELRIMEVNGIPGLKPHKSWVPQLYTMHRQSPLGEEEDYRQLIGAIIESGRHRYGI